MIRSLRAMAFAGVNLTGRRFFMHSLIHLPPMNSGRSSSPDYRTVRWGFRYQEWDEVVGGDDGDGNILFGGVTITEGALTLQGFPLS